MLLWSHWSLSEGGNVCFRFGLPGSTLWQSHFSKGCILKDLEKPWPCSFKNCTVVLPGSWLSLISTLHTFRVPLSRERTNQLWPQQNSSELCCPCNRYLCLWHHKIKMKRFWVFRFNSTRLELSGSALGSLTCSGSAGGIGSWWWKSCSSSNESIPVSNLWTHLSRSPLASEVPKVANNHLICGSYSKSWLLRDKLEDLTLFYYQNPGKQHEEHGNTP